MKRAACFATALLLLSAASARAYLFMPAPIPDALTRAAAWIKDHPTRAEGYFFLARINGSAWAKGDVGKDAEVPIGSYGDAETGPYFVPWDSLMYQRPAGAEVTVGAKAYLIASLHNYHKAVELEAKNPLYQLGLAWALEQAAGCRLDPPAEIVGTTALSPEQSKQVDAALAQLGDPDFGVRDKAAQLVGGAMPAAAKALLAVKSQNPEVTAGIDGILRRYWMAQAAEHYRQAYALSCAGGVRFDRDLVVEQFRAPVELALDVGVVQFGDLVHDGRFGGGLGGLHLDDVGLRRDAFGRFDFGAGDAFGRIGAYL